MTVIALECGCPYTVPWLSGRMSTPKCLIHGDFSPAYEGRHRKDEETP